MITWGLNQLLKDSTALIPFADRIVTLSPGGTWRITDEGLLQATTLPADATIGINLAAAPLFLTDRPAFNRSVCFEGDEKLAMGVARALAGLRFDSEEMLSQWLGDVLAHRVVSTLKALKPQGFAALQMLAEYFRDEASVLLTREESEDFYQAVDTLAADIDRLEKRIMRLQGG
jgi:ubiquinone biosynthesis protein UbiJ